MTPPAPKPSRLSAIAVATVVLALGGCGADERTIPAADGELLLAQLEEVRSAFAADGCETTLPAAIAELERQVQSLPDSVGEEVAGALEDGVSRLDTLADRDCEVETTTETTVETEPTTTAPPVTVPTETVETKTKETEPPPEKPDEQPVEEQPEEPVDDEFVPPGQRQGEPPAGGDGGPEGFSGRGGRQ